MAYQIGREIDAVTVEELERLLLWMRNIEVESVKLAQLNAAPARYQDGMIVYADGTNWNPGGGQGIYARYAGAWNKL